MQEFLINKTIRVTAEIDRDPGYGSPEGPRSVSYTLFYPAGSYRALHSGTLPGRGRQELQCKAPDGFMVWGSLMTQTNDTETVLGGNLFYGFSERQGLQNHFEGTIALFPKNAPPEPPNPPDRPAEDDQAESFSLDSPLFPYIYVQPWPDSLGRHAELDFLSYDVSVAPPASLYARLVTLAAEKDRAGMEALALAFLENKAPFEGQYFGGLSSVPEPYREYPDIYDELRRLESFDGAVEWLAARLGVAELRDLVSGEDSGQVPDQVWQNYFALSIVNGYAGRFLVELNKILSIEHLLDQTVIHGRHELERLLMASVVLPSPVFPLPPYANAGGATGKDWIEPYAIGQLKMTKYRLLRYQPGEVAHIQNVLRGEKKRSVRRSLSQTAEQESESRQDARRDSTGELVVEAQKTMAALTRHIKYDKLTTTYGPPTQMVLDGTYSDSVVPGDDTGKNPSSFVTKVLDATLSRINESVHSSRVSGRFNEEEEVSSSVFDNQRGDGHFRGIFRWVNKVYRVTVENYGYRFLLEFRIGQPAAEFIATQQDLNDLDLRKPLSPAQQKVQDFRDITRLNYVPLLRYYGIDRTMLPPEETQTVTGVLNGGDTGAFLDVPSGYAGASAILSGQVSGSVSTVAGLIGTKAFSLTASTPSQTLELAGETGRIPFSVINPGLPAEPAPPEGSFLVHAAVTCNLAEKRLDEWKAEVFAALQSGYRRMLGEYDERLTRLAGTDKRSNPLLLSGIEKSCLHRRCVDMLLGVSAAKVGDAPGVDPSLRSVNRQRYVQFITESFEWTDMSYTLNDQPSPRTYAQQGEDDSLRPFLQASGAKVYLPVRPESNFQVLYYLSSGMIWDKLYPFVPVDPGDEALAAHLKAVHFWLGKRAVEKSWEVALPTAMQIVQEGPQLPVFFHPNP